VTNDRVPDPYRTLGVDQAAPPEEVRRAYLRAIRAVHPDVAPGREDEARAINQAYRAILARQRAASTPASGATAPPPPSPPQTATRPGSSGPRRAHRPSVAERVSLWTGAILVVGIALWAGTAVRSGPSAAPASEPNPATVIAECEMEVSAAFGRALDAHDRADVAVTRAAAAGGLSEEPARLDGSLAAAESGVRRLDRGRLSDAGRRLVSSFLELLEQDRVTVAHAAQRRWDLVGAGQRQADAQLDQTLDLIRATATLPLCHLADVLGE
jgi:curved DNA-binding protein CbpA